MRRWCIRFGPLYANRLRKRSGPGGDQWFDDEVFVRIDGRQLYLFRAVDQDGLILDVLLQKRRNKAAAARFFRKLLKLYSAERLGGSSPTSLEATPPRIAR